jgi:hypothetical protein
MADERDLRKALGLQKGIDMLRIPPDLLLPLSPGFSMTGKLEDDRNELFFKIPFLKTPYKLPSPCPMDEENHFPPF